MRAVDAWAIEEQGVPSLDLMERAGAGLARVTAGGRASRADPRRRRQGQQRRRRPRCGAPAARGRPRGRRARGRGPRRAAGRRARQPRAPPGRRAASPSTPTGSRDRARGRRPAGHRLRGRAARAARRRAIARDQRRRTRPWSPATCPRAWTPRTGEVEGEAVRAAVTATFHAPKLGLYVNPGKAHAGEVEVVEIGIPRGAPGAGGAGLISERVLDLYPRRDAAAAPSSTSGVRGGGRRLARASPARPRWPRARLSAPARATCRWPCPAPAQQALDLRLLEQMSRGLPERRRLPHAGRRRGRRGDGRARRRRGARPGPRPRPTAPRSSPAAWPAPSTSPLLVDADGLNAHAGPARAARASARRRRC